MPRYFFNIMEGSSQNLVRDIEGAVLADAGEARKEALGLAQDITRHRIHQPAQTWSVIVTDESGDEILAVPFSEISARKSPGPLAFLNRIARFEASFGRGTVVWLFAATLLAITLQGAITIVRITKRPGSYQTASASPQGTFVAVRFASQASMASISQFLSVYHASLAGGPRPGNLYRLRLSDDSMPSGELAKIAKQMAQDPVVEFAVPVQ